jgi:hypothetical protein
MKNNDDIHSTDTTEIKRLINRVKQGKLDQGDALLIEKLLNILLTTVSLLERKHTSIRRMKELLFGTKEKNDEAAILGVDASLPQRAAVQSYVRRFNPDPVHYFWRHSQKYPAIQIEAEDSERAYLSGLTAHLGMMVGFCGGSSALKNEKRYCPN